MAELPESFIAGMNELYGVDASLIQLYTHKFLIEFDDGAEAGEVTFVVSMMHDELAGRAPNAKVATSPRVRMMDDRRLCVNKDYARSLPPAKLKVPAIGVMVRHPSGRVYGDVCDGNHRIYAAWLLGHESYPIIQLDEAESKRFVAGSAESFAWARKKGYI